MKKTTAVAAAAFTAALCSNCICIAIAADNETKTTQPGLHREVYLPGGKPAVGVKVTIYRTNDADADTITVNKKGLCEADYDVRWKKSADGSYNAASVPVVVKAPGMAMVVSDIGNWLPLNGENPFPLYLVPEQSGYVFKGKVVTAEGKAVPNAEVVLSEFTEGSFAPWRPRKGNARISQLETRSLADGSFSFPSLVLDTHEPLRGGMGCIISKVIEAKAKVNGVVQHGRLSSRTDAPAVVRLELPAAVSTERK